MEEVNESSKLFYPNASKTIQMCYICMWGFLSNTNLAYIKKIIYKNLKKNVKIWLEQLIVELSEG